MFTLQTTKATKQAKGWIAALMTRHRRYFTQAPVDAVMASHGTENWPAAYSLRLEQKHLIG